MADEVVVKTAMVTLTAATPTVIGFVPTHTLSLAPSEPFASSDSNEMLLESDLEASFSTYTSPYNETTYLLGTLTFQSLKSVTNLSEVVTKDGEPIVTKKTEGTITCSAAGATDKTTSAPAQIPDPNSSYDFDFVISNAGQTLASSD